jgi:hypothetical protein
MMLRSFGRASVTRGDETRVRFLRKPLEAHASRGPVVHLHVDAVYAAF